MILFKNSKIYGIRIEIIDIIAIVLLLTNKLIINNITGSNIDIIECVENNEFRIKKTNTFNVEQLMLLFNQIDISNIYEKNEYFYFTIADTIMIDIVMRRSWEKLYNIKDLCDVYRKNTIEFLIYLLNF